MAVIMVQPLPSPIRRMLDSRCRGRAMASLSRAVKSRPSTRPARTMASRLRICVTIWTSAICRSAEASDQIRFDLEAARAAYQIAQLELSYTNIVAPIDGEAHALRKLDEVRRSVKPRADSGFAAHARQHRRDRPLAVRARDLNFAESVLGIS